MKPFWILWCPTGPTPPRVRFSTEKQALKVAEKMAAEHPGQEFFVLLTVARSVRREVTTERFDMAPVPLDRDDGDDDIPF